MERITQIDRLTRGQYVFAILGVGFVGVYVTEYVLAYALGFSFARMGVITQMSQANNLGDALDYLFWAARIAIFIWATYLRLIDAGNPRNGKTLACSLLALIPIVWIIVACMPSRSTPPTTVEPWGGPTIDPRPSKPKATLQQAQRTAPWPPQVEPRPYPNGGLAPYVGFAVLAIAIIIILVAGHGG
jgi:hypothetical protein